MRHWISVTATIWRRFSTTVRRRLTIPGLVALIVLGSIPAASPALGCSGTALFGEESEPPSEAVIFTGTAVKVDDPRLPFDPIMSSGDLMEWTFVVDGIERGPSLGRITVRSERMDASCGFPFRLGSRYRVVAIDRGHGLHTGSGSGTTELESLANPPSIEQSGSGSPLIPLAVLSFVVVGLVFLLVFVRRLRQHEAAR